MPRGNSRTAQGSGTIRQRKNGLWEARYTAGRDPGTGKQIQRSIYGASEKEVLQKLQRTQVDITDGTYIEPSKLTIGAWLDIWTVEYLGGVKPRTVENYKSVCENHLKPKLGALKLTALSAHTVQGLYNKCQQGEKPLSPKSVRNIHGVLHKALKQAVKLNYIKVNPCDACELPRYEKKDIKPLDDEAIKAFLTAIQSHKWENLLIVTLFTGARQGEILGLTWSCVDFKNGVIIIDRQRQRNNELATTKNSKSRRISPAPYVMAALKEQRRRQSENRLLAGSLWEDTDLVFTNEFGKPPAHCTISRAYKSIIKGLGYPESRYHDLRHSYAVAALQSGDDVKTVQETLGHHTAAFTLDQYGHVTERMKRESAERMERYIQDIKASS
jgi:integrase